MFNSKQVELMSFYIEIPMDSQKRAAFRLHKLQRTNPRPAYQIINSWIAYQEYNKEKDNWILYVRSPKGETKPIFETPSQTWK